MSWTCDVSIEEKVRQDCYNRGYEEGRKNPCDEIVAHTEELQKQLGDLKDIIVEMEQGYYPISQLRENMEKEKEQAVKDKIEKFATKLENSLDSVDIILHEDNGDAYLSFSGVIELIDKICKEMVEAE